MPEALPGGPYLQLAAFCERVLTEKDGVISLIRVIDRLVLTRMGPDVPSEMPPTPVRINVVISLKSGDARGTHQIRVRPEAPSGLRLPAFEAPVYFEGEDRGVNVIAELDLVLEQPGLYWFDVLFGDREALLTRLPLRVIYQPLRTGRG